MTPQAPLGIHPVIWLIVFLLVGPPALLSKTAAKVPGIAGAAGRWWQGREPAAASYRVSQAEIERLQQDYNRLRSDYEKLVTHNVEQDARMDALDKDLTEEKTRFWVAIGYIRRLIDSHQRHAPDAEILAPPKELDGII